MGKSVRFVRSRSFGSPKSSQDLTMMLINVNFFVKLLKFCCYVYKQRETHTMLLLLHRLFYLIIKYVIAYSEVMRNYRC